MYVVSEVSDVVAADVLMAASPNMHDIAIQIDSDLDGFATSR